MALFLFYHLLRQEFGHRVGRFLPKDGQWVHFVPDQDLLDRVSEEMVLHPTPWREPDQGSGVDACVQWKVEINPSHHREDAKAYYAHSRAPQRMWWRPLLGGGLFPWSSGTWPTVTKGSVTQTRNQPKVKTSIRVCHLFANFLFMTFLFLKSILSCCVRCARWRNCSVSKGHPWCWLARLDWCPIIIPHRESSASGKGKIFIDLLP